MKRIRSGPRNFFRLLLIDTLLKDMSGCTQVLDAGGGDGSISVCLAKRGCRVETIESDEGSCAVIEARAKEEGVSDRITVLCTTIEEAAAEKGRFDCVVCAEVLEHVDNDARVLKILHEYLRPDGRLVISVPLAGKGWDVWDTMSGHRRLYKYDALVAALHAAGFSVEKSFSWGYPLMKLYHRLVFLPWAGRARGEREIRDEKLTLTRVGKNRLLSVLLGGLFLADIIFTPKRRGIGTAIRARKVSRETEQ